MSDQDNTSPNVEAVITESAPVNETPETPTAVNDTESAPVVVQEENQEPSKAVKDLIGQRKRRQQAEQEAAYWKGRAEALGGTEVKKPAPVVTQPTIAVPEAPILDNFETYEQFEAAKDSYVVARTRYEIQLENQQEAQRKQVEKVQLSFDERIQKAAIDNPEIIDIRNDETLPISPPMGAILMESEHSPEMLMWLSNNRKEAKRISMLPPILAAKELGILEAQIKNKPKPEPPKKVSQAPEPIQTVGATGSGVVDESNLPIDQWIARRNKAQFGR